MPDISMVLLTKLEYLEKTRNLQTQWLRDSRALPLGPSVWYLTGTHKHFVNANKVTPRNLWDNMLSNTTK